MLLAAKKKKRNCRTLKVMHFRLLVFAQRNIFFSWRLTSAMQKDEFFPDIKITKAAFNIVVMKSANLGSGFARFSLPVVC
jgi:hypothetical protein